MEFSELVKRRYSVRSYNGKKVEQEKVEKILEAAHAAPTAANLQPVRLLVIRQELKNWQKRQIFTMRRLP